MRHNFYANCKSRVTPGGSRKSSDQSRQPPYYTKSKKTINKFVLPLGDLARIVLDKHAEDPKLIEEIRNKIAMYRINYSIADDIGSDRSKNELTKDLRNYLIKLYEKEK